MSKPTRIQLRRTKGWRLQETSQTLNGLPAVKVTRPGKWGNPFVIGKEFCRNKMNPGGGQISNTVQDGEHAVALFKRFTAREVAIQIAAYQELRGKNLACFCPLDQPCHADVLLELANSPKNGKL